MSGICDGVVVRTDGSHGACVLVVGGELPFGQQEGEGVLEQRMIADSYA